MYSSGTAVIAVEIKSIMVMGIGMIVKLTQGHGETIQLAASPCYSRCSGQ